MIIRCNKDKHTVVLVDLLVRLMRVKSCIALPETQEYEQKKLAFDDPEEEEGNDQKV